MSDPAETREDDPPRDDPPLPNDARDKEGDAPPQLSPWTTGNPGRAGNTEHP